MPRVLKEVIEHRFAVRQKVRRQALERQAFIREEVAWLLEADFIREVIHPEWLANLVVAPKANGKLRMCIDYTDLNKACPKDPFHLPHIDQIVDSTAGLLEAGINTLYVAIDKFTKWPEAYPIVKINKHSALKFIRGITSRFGVPNRIITDNGTQFTSELFGDYCNDMGIKLCFASPAHPKSNGQVERANAEILKGLKTKMYNVLKKHGDSRLEELPTVLWANRTTPSRATGETPFFLVYGAEAVLPSELSLGSPRVALYNEANQDDLRRDDLVYLEEWRRRVALRAACYQQSLWRYHQRLVRAQSLQVGDLVLRRVQSRLG
nr:uncharacterized protein K02A2.6-like [Oryza sativa Japonica Group]